MLLREQTLSCSYQRASSVAELLVKSSWICATFAKAVAHVTLQNLLEQPESKRLVCQKATLISLSFWKVNTMFSHMTPSYGAGRCITVKGINTINHDGNWYHAPTWISHLEISKEPLAKVLERGMENEWLGPIVTSVSLENTLNLFNFITKLLKTGLKRAHSYQCHLNMVSQK